MVRHRQKRSSGEAVSPRVLNAAKEISKQLTTKGYPHALIGGLALRYHGYNRATSDVDFLVSSEAAGRLVGEALGGEVQGKTIRSSKGVTIDLLFPRPGEKFLEKEIRAAYNAGIPAISRQALVYMKLVAGRLKDQADVVELIKRGKIDRKKVGAFLNKHRPDLVEEFESLEDLASVEAD
jgi:hypothetical protein